MEDVITTDIPNNASTEPGAVDKPRTYVIDVWEGESIWTWEGVATTDEEAEEAAVEALNEAWDRDYADMDAMRQEVDGVAVIPHPAVMADREPQEAFDAKVKVVEKLAWLLKDGFLDELPVCDRDDFQALIARTGVA